MSVAAGGDASSQPESLSRAEQKGTVVIYSPYINKLKTIQEGRRLPQNLCVEDPTAWEILECAKRLLGEENVVGENKGYSRDYEAQWPPMRGRIRCRLLDGEGKHTNPEVKNRRDLFVKVCEMIPRMQCRQPGYFDKQGDQSERVKGGNKKKNRRK